MITIYHNPRCSKSREALALVERFSTAKGLTLHVIDYQKTPLTLAQLTSLQQQLGVTVREMVRDNEEEYAALNLAQADDATLLQAVEAHPKLLQRPIVVRNARAVIGRPPERINVLLQSE
jgi:arsenate reductase (glutaredoxin)